jgi:hypothetical protein
MSLVARVMQDVLSSKIVNGGSSPVGCSVWLRRGLCKDNLCKMQRIGISSMCAILRAIYSVSVVLRKISDCNILPKWSGQP